MMIRQLAEFESQARQLTQMEALTSLTDAMARSMSFRWFTLIRPRASAQHDTSILLTTYPEGWVEQIFSEQRHLNDPIHAAALRSTEGVQWSDVGRLVPLDNHQRETLSLAGDHGLHNGFTVPFRLTGMPSAMFSVAVSQRSEIKPETVLAAKLLGSIVFARAQTFVTDTCHQGNIVRLSPRQIDCIRLITLGLSDYAIGAELGISAETVREYVESARQRYGVKRRTQLIPAAIRDGHLTIEEAVGWFKPELNGLK